MRQTSLDHVLITIPPGEAAERLAREFYAGALMLSEISKPPLLAARGGIWFQGPGFQLHLGVEQDFRPAKKAHPAFRTRDVDRLAQVLQSAGITITWDNAIPGQRLFYADDPFGNRLEFMAE